MNINGKHGLLVLIFLIVLSCKTQKTDEGPLVTDYHPFFNQTKKSYVPTPSPKNDRLDTVVQILSNFRDEEYTFTDTFSIVNDIDFYSGELIIDIDLINEKPPIFDTFMVVKGFLMNEKLVDKFFPVIPDSLKIALMLLDSTSNGQFITNETTPIQPSSKSTNQPKATTNIVQFSDSSEIIRFYSREEILADTTRDLFDADTLINNIFTSTGWHVGDSIPYYKGFSDLTSDSTIKFITDTAYVEIHDPSREVKQYPEEELTKEVIETKKIADKFIHTNKVVFKRFYKNEIDVFIDMVRVKGDRFKIGNNEFDEDERPEYGIEVSRFLIGKYEITNDIFCVFVNLLHCDSLGKINRLKVFEPNSPYTKVYWDKGTGQFKVYKGYEKHPAVNVSWAGANLICKAMGDPYRIEASLGRFPSKDTGGRLPSEAEWEFAAKGGIYAIRYYTDLEKKNWAYEQRYAGDNFMGGIGWFVDNSEGFYHQVGAWAPNRLGLYDMCGNVWEWCYDNYDKEFYKRNGDSTDPMCLNSNGLRVNRGGSWSSDAIYCRITNRNFLNEFQYNPYLGFRLMREWK